MKPIHVCVAIALSLPISLSIASAAFSQRDEPCQAYTVETQGPYEYKEVNNCPLSIKGTFSNANWRVSVYAWEPAAYQYIGINRYNGSRIAIIDFDVAGTTSRPQYRFTNEDFTYVVTFRYSEPDTIRVQVYQNDRLILNELLDRESDEIMN